MRRTTTGVRAACAVTAWLLMSSPPLGAESGREGDPPALDEIPDPLPLAWCLERARLANPSLARAEAAARAAFHRVEPAGAWEDPRLGYEASNVPVGDLDFRSTALSGHQLRLQQKLPFPGLLSSRQGAARRGAESFAALAEHHGLTTAAAVESAWAELAFAQRALDITERNIVLLRKLAATAETRYRVGSGLQQDVLRAHVELTALLGEDLDRRETIARAEATLVALLDLPGDIAIPRTEALAMTSLPPALTSLLEALDERNPRLDAARNRIEAARLRVRTAQLEGLPDIDLGIGYRIRQRVAGDPVNGDDFLGAGLTVRLPLSRSKWQARTAEARAELRRAEAELREARAELVAQTRRAHAALTRAAAEEALLETGLVPQARQSLASSRSAYEVGRIGFLSLLDSQVRLLTAELRLERARADKHLAFASLEAAAGETLR